MQANNLQNVAGNSDDTTDDSDIEQFLKNILRISENRKKGIYNDTIEYHGSNVMLRRVTDEVNSWLDSYQLSINEINEDITKIAKCEFDFEMKTKSSGPFGELNKKLFTTLSNLNQAMRQMYDFNQSIHDTSRDIAVRNEELSNRTHDQGAALDMTKDRMKELSTIVEENSRNAMNVNKISTDASKQAEQGSEAVQNMVSSMLSIKQSAKKIQGITDMIRELAFQTNLLSLNAAVEAARAGEHGRGFSIVASEVRSLAQRCTDATNDIESLVSESGNLIEEGESMAHDVEAKMQSIQSSIVETANLMQEITTSAEQQDQDIKQTIGDIDKLDAITVENRDLVQVLKQNTGVLDQQSRFMVDAVNVFRIRKSNESMHPAHQAIKKISMQTAEQIAQLFQSLILQNRISQEQMFDTHYVPIEGTNPQKYTTQFDAILDQVLPPIQEPILDQNEFIVFAGAVDRNGYFPSHNKRFSKKLTGDFNTDLVNNRTKRIFDDRVGLTAGIHTEQSKLQIYRRDTGELMFDMSAPIFVNGQHWGGFRVGYKLA